MRPTGRAHTGLVPSGLQARRACIVPWPDHALESPSVLPLLVRGLVVALVPGDVVALVALTEAKAAEQALARKGPHGWISDDAKLSSANLRGKQEALKQNQWGTVRYCWSPVLARIKEKRRRRKEREEHQGDWSIVDALILAPP